MGLEINKITGQIVDASYCIHSRVGGGLLESVYLPILAAVLRKRGLRVETESSVPLVFEGLRFREAFRADLIVESAVVVELKSIERIAPVHKKQLLTYLRLLNMQVGLLINFGAPLIKDGIVRVVNNYQPPNQEP